MKVEIIYNPFIPRSTFNINGKVLKSNSALNVQDMRLQEWAEKFPEVIEKEYFDKNVEIDFTGMESDFEDLQNALSNSDLSLTYHFNKKTDISYIENEVDKIFEDIRKGPIEELHSEQISADFSAAKNERFDVNVVATVSSGKSTLINALIGKCLLPAANAATTAKIVKIISDDQVDFNAVVKNKAGQDIKTINNVTLDQMDELNRLDEDINIELYGRIPFVSTTGMKLVVIDTPGPNNARSQVHRDTTYNMLNDSEKSLVLFVINGASWGVNDERNLLHYVCDVMNNGGKKSRDRFLFVVNKLDQIKPWNKSEKSIKETLDDIKNDLEEMGIRHPHIFPVSSIVALQKRAKVSRARELRNFKDDTKDYESLCFDRYREYSHLPKSSYKKIEHLQIGADDDTLAEIHSGLPSLEQSIGLFVNKYARTTKVRNLVLSFNSKVNDEYCIVENLLTMISESEGDRQKRLHTIRDIKSKIKKAEESKTLPNKVKELGLESKLNELVTTEISSAKKKVNDKKQSMSSHVEKSTALIQCKQLENEFKDFPSQIKSQCIAAIKREINTATEQMIKECMDFIERLGLSSNFKDISFTPNIQITNKGEVNKESFHKNITTESVTTKKKEKYYVTVEGTRSQKMSKYGSIGGIMGLKLGTIVPGIGNLIGGAIGAGIGAFAGAMEGTGSTREERTRMIDVKENKDFVDMQAVAKEYLAPVTAELDTLQKQLKEASKQTASAFDKQMDKQIKLIFDFLISQQERLQKEMTELQATELQQKEYIRRKEWLEHILTRLDNLINY